MYSIPHSGIDKAGEDASRIGEADRDAEADSDADSKVTGAAIFFGIPEGEGSMGISGTGITKRMFGFRVFALEEIIKAPKNISNATMPPPIAKYRKPDPFFCDIVYLRVGYLMGLCQPAYRQAGLPHFFGALPQN